MIITIDGPNSVGKGTLATKLAEHYDCSYFDTGMLYRAVAMEMFISDLDINNEEEAKAVADNLTYFKMIELSGIPEFRGPKISNFSAVVASYPSVRYSLLKMQQDFAVETPNVIFDGRDTGTVVVPHADIKFFVTASSEVRAERRYKAYIAKGVDISYEQVLADVIERDERDINRAVSPLKPAADAIILDTSNLSVEEVFIEACRIIDKKI